MFIILNHEHKGSGVYKFFTGRCLDRQEAHGGIYLGLKACHFASLRNTQ